MINLLLLASLILHTSCLNSDFSLEQKQQCVIDKYEELDSQLNAVYESVHNTLNQEQSDRLRKAQIAWLAFRDADCANADSIITHNLCLAKITQQRISGLQSVYSNLLIGYTPVDYASYLGENKSNLPDYILLGNWRNQYKSLQFKIVNNERLFTFITNEQKFDGYWQFIDAQLMLSDENGNILHLYNQVLLEQDSLILFKKEGNIEKYYRVIN